MTSFPSNIEQICSIAKDYNNILDIGSAFGKYGLLIRETIASNRSEHGDLSPDLSDIIIDSCENAKYFDKFKWLDYIYNNRINESALNLTSGVLSNYNLILLIDVIEHWTREQFKEFMSKVKCDVLISTPKRVVMYECRHYDFDPHITQYNDDDFIGWSIHDTENSFIRVIHNS